MALHKTFFLLFSIFLLVNYFLPLTFCTIIYHNFIFRKVLLYFSDTNMVSCVGNGNLLVVEYKKLSYKEKLNKTHLNRQKKLFKKGESLSSERVLEVIFS